MILLLLFSAVVMANETYSEYLKIWRMQQGKNLLAFTFDFTIP